ncbi:MAG: class I SAM-dependent methyltransferase [Melioribacteraceae bacterium]|nr:class I SAM-dependent methyltransferase [Melioribacteraceae bacterium]
MDRLSNKEFFNDVSQFYDEMINFTQTLERKTNNLKEFLSPHRVLQTNIRTAADIGCGSGIDSIALASLGVDVSGFDSSKMMVKKAEENSKRINKKINFYNYTAQNIPDSFNSKFDFICSLGNTAANIPPKDIPATINRFAELLDENGKLLFHILNYEKIIRVNERIVNINKGESDYLIRFYDFEKDFINFNILKFAVNNPKERELISTKVYPHSLELFLKLLEENNFINVEVYQDLKKTRFNSETSNDIYFYAEKA